LFFTGLPSLTTSLQTRLVSGADLVSFSTATTVAVAGFFAGSAVVCAEHAVTENNNANDKNSDFIL
jgi:hypothetical protein